MSICFVPYFVNAANNVHDAVFLAIDQCRQPRDPGPCRADLQRYFYDEKTKECRPFIYGGCQGNTNNFETAEDCYNQCDVPEDQRRIQTAGR